MTDTNASKEQNQWDIDEMSLEMSLDSILPYRVPSTEIDNIRLFNILHQPEQRLVQATTRKHHLYSQSVAMLQN
jgi:hypothetical protein